MQIITRSSAASTPSSRNGRSHNPTPLSDRDASVIDMADFRSILLLYTACTISSLSRVQKLSRPPKRGCQPRPYYKLKEVSKILFLANLKSLSCKLLAWAERRWCVIFCYL